jgi:hypothetical protein
MQPPPVNPAGGLQSFLEGFQFDEYSKIQKLLTTINLGGVDHPSPAWRPSTPFPDPPSLIPPQQRTDSFSYTDTVLYNRLVQVLQQLFPTDFPTTNL